MSLLPELCAGEPRRVVDVDGLMDEAIDPGHVDQHLRSDPGGGRAGSQGYSGWDKWVNNTQRSDEGAPLQIYLEAVTLHFQGV